MEITTEDQRQQRRRWIQEVDALMTRCRQQRQKTEFDEDVVVESLKIAGRKTISEGKHIVWTVGGAFNYSEMDIVNVLLYNNREPVVDDLQQLLKMLWDASGRKAELQELVPEIEEVLEHLKAVGMTATANLTTYNVPEVYDLIVQHMEEDAVKINDTDRLASRLTTDHKAMLQDKISKFIMHKRNIREMIQQIPVRLKRLKEDFPVLSLLRPGDWSVDMLRSKSTSELNALCKLFVVSTLGAFEKEDLVNLLKPVLCHRSPMPDIKRRQL